MSKYSEELKIKVVKYCIEDYHSYGEATRHFNIKDSKAVSKWVKKYQEHGIQGLTKNNKKYDGNFKKKVENICMKIIYH